jgi:hypothetical protein
MLKELSARAIDKDLIATLGPDVMTYSTISHYLHDANCSPSSRLSLDECSKIVETNKR